MGLFTKIFGTYSDRQIKKITPIVDKIEALGDTYANMSDNDMKSKTLEFKDRLKQGETLDDILPEAYALVREAADRVLGKRPFRVQLMCGILLHQGRIAEMKTGEGKTLVALMPAYLNALTGEGVHVITVNEYLARLGCEEMGRVHEFLGLSTGLIVPNQSVEEKQHAYKCDITYGTNNEFGFDYLRDSLAYHKNGLLQRGYAFAIVDEVDSVFIDEARTPLIISGEGKESTEMYEKADKFVKSLRKLVVKELDSKSDYDDVAQDYIVDESARATVLTKHGVEKAEKYFNVENITDSDNSNIYHCIQQALKANGVMHRDVDYVVQNDQIVIVDTFTGRLTPGRRYNDGLHQAIEAKERVNVKEENRTVASITFQNYFRMYKKLSGMSGTALSEEVEFREIYNLDVVVVPTNKPMIRKDYTDIVYLTTEAKYRGIINQIKECHKKGQPVLVGTVSIEKSEALSKRLKGEGIPHNVLNAKYHEREAEIVAQAGKLGAVTISTNMAGRGTDIMLGGNAEFLAKRQMKDMGYDDHVITLATGSSQSVGEDVLLARNVYKDLYNQFKVEIEPEAEKVRRAGGLFVIGTERHDSRRIDNQLRGRSGRQGDPGESRFFVSFEDDMIRLFGGESLLSAVANFGIRRGLEDQPIELGFVAKRIEQAQGRAEYRNFTSRKNVLQYDDVLNQQRSIIYAQRIDVLKGADIKDKIEGMIRNSINDAVDKYLPNDDKDSWSLDELKNKYMILLCNENDFLEDNITKKQILDLLTKRALDLWNSKENRFGVAGARENERVKLLKNVTNKWMDHLEAMDELRDYIRLQAYASRNPISEYKIYGAEMFDEMVFNIREDTVREVLSATEVDASIEFIRNYVTGFQNNAPKSKKVTKSVQQPVRNTEPKPNKPCPCGSGRSYKKCCGRNVEEK